MDFEQPAAHDIPGEQTHRAGLLENAVSEQKAQALRAQQTLWADYSSVVLCHRGVEPRWRLNGHGA